MISKSSEIHNGASIGTNVEIGAFCSIAEDVIIGEGTRIEPHVTIMNGARIGAHCHLFPGAVIAAIPQDLKFNREYSTATIKSGTTIRECVTVNRGTSLDRGDTYIGENCVLMAYTHVAHDCVIDEGSILANSVQMAGHVHIGKYAFIGGTTAIHQYVKIGAYSMISGGSLVRKDVPPFVTAAREPLAYSGINSIGLRRQGFTSYKIREIQDIYRIFYLSGLNNSEAMNKIRLEMNPSKERDDILRFIEDSSRGLMRGGMQG